MEIPFFKAHGDGNDFLITWESEASIPDPSRVARAICDRHTGVGADGWILARIESGAGHDAAITLYNADGGVAELSGNGTRCAAALLIYQCRVSRPRIRILTGAGIKELRLIERDENRFVFEMNMGRPKLEPEGLKTSIDVPGGPVEATLIDVGNPQCVVIADEFPADWRKTGAALEHHSRFPNRTNVSFVKAAGEHAIEILIWERGVGETQSSGTGASGAAAAAILSGIATSPVEVRTPAGTLRFRWEDGGDAYLTGPAEIIARGAYFSA